MLTKASFAVSAGPQKNRHRKEKQSEGGGGLVPKEGQRQAELSSVVAQGPHVDPSSPFEVVLLEFSDQGPVGSMTPK